MEMEGGEMEVARNWGVEENRGRGWVLGMKPYWKQESKERGGGGEEVGGWKKTEEVAEF